ncbi:hypothetical protein M8J77_025875 [Diaphorina citri]|nr:hypothetical protein M8J77_025875 [Diaphorina citri]
MTWKIHLLVPLEMDTVDEQHNFKKNFECIYYPAIVQNDDRAIQSLGGLHQISEVINDSSQRLELKFRPDDPYCRPACSEKVSCRGLVVKMKVIKKRKKSGKETLEIIPQVMGKVSSCYRFRGMCDYQFLPTSSHEDGTVTDLLPDLLFDNITTLEDFNRDVELFLPPLVFSRIETPQMQLKLFHDNEKSSEAEENKHLISLTRKSREQHINIIPFSHEGVPQPFDQSAAIAKYIESKLITQSDVDALVKAFEIRPVVSRMMLCAMSNVSVKKTRLILPLIAYYFSTGPYRVMWIKMGYDPRTDKSSGIYQVLNFRVRNVLSFSGYKIEPKRRSTLLRMAIKCQSNEEPKDSKPPEKYYMYRAGYIPPFRQMYYQLCDVDVPSVKELLASSPLRDVCHEKHGWYSETLFDDIRTIITNSIVKTLSDMDDSKSVDEGEREGDEEDESFMDDESLIENVDMEDPEDLKIDEEEEDLDFDFDED